MMLVNINAQLKIFLVAPRPRQKQQFMVSKNVKCAFHPHAVKVKCIEGFANPRLSVKGDMSRYFRVFRENL